MFPDHFVYTSVGSRRAIEKAAVRPRAGRHRGLPAPGDRHRRAARVAPRLGEPRRGPRATSRDDPSLRRPDRPRRRDADRLPRAARAATRRATRRASREHESRRARRAVRGRDARGASHRRRARVPLLRRRTTRSSATSAARPCCRRSGSASTSRRGSRSSSCIPAEQSRGRGKELVHAVADRARELGAHDLLLASAVPRYLWPGVDVAQHARRHAARDVRLRARLGRHQHGDRHRVPPRAARPASSSSARPAPARTSSPRGAYPVLGARARPRGHARHRVRGARRRRRDDRLRLSLGEPLRLDRTDGDRPDVAARRRRLGRRRRAVRRPRSPRLRRPARSRGSATSASTASAARASRACSSAASSGYSVTSQSYIAFGDARRRRDEIAATFPWSDSTSMGIELMGIERLARWRSAVSRIVDSATYGQCEARDTSRSGACRL